MFYFDYCKLYHTFFNFTKIKFLVYNTYIKRSETYDKKEKKILIILILFLDYSATILNKSPNSIKEYNYDLMMFLRFIKIHFGLTNETDFTKIKINDISLDTIKKN